MLQSRFIAHRPTFSSVDEHIVQVILTMPYDPDLTSTSLAKRCDVSQSTIVRFAQKLGYASFREFLSDYVSFKHHQEGIIHLSESTTSLQRMKESLNYIEAYAQSSLYQDVF
ncbi:MAG: MurR/RpiR family transcriptional regulator, partial [Erysipelothrix sp.]|nr:MurR/RpiR family transcriptional regulator [Erysipelothrix sp.]